MNFLRRNMSSSSAAIKPARILKQSSYQVACKLLITEHFFEVPKDHSKPSEGSIRVFGRSARRFEHHITSDLSKPRDKEKDQLPWMVFFQGGPGQQCGPPQNSPWTNKFVDAGYQVLFLDQRGTGLSTAITARELQKLGDAAAQAKYLKLFRADNIVRDAEAIRLALTQDYPEENRKWATAGQSFGGFCTLNYLSFFPESLRECFIFGGLAYLGDSPDPVYKRTFQSVKERNEVYYKKYPEDEQRVKDILAFLAKDKDGSVILPTGGNLTRRRFLQIGMAFGFHGYIDTIHNIVLQATTDIELFGEISYSTLLSIDKMSNFDTNPIYAILHEPIYCQGNNAPKWSAWREQQNHPEFHIDRTDGPVYFTGEMIFPHMFEDFVELRKMREAAELLANDADWPPLYDLQQLAKNTVPVYAASYIHDMYVPQDLAMETASKVRGTKVFVTNLMFHDAMRTKMEEVVGKLFLLRDDLVD